MSNPFDSHCHPQFSHYDHDRNEVILRGSPLLCVGTDLETSKKAIELAQKYPEVWATVGVHPNDLENFSMDEIERLLEEEKVVAIGEVGLDYYRTVDKEKHKKQKEVFEQFIELAHRYQKPLVLHCRDAASGSRGHSHQDALEILRNKRDILHGGVAHSFTGTPEEAKEYLKLGFHLGFNGIITFARQYDEVVIHTPLDKILLETDAPYLTPEPYRGQRNEPAYVLEVAKKVAELKGISVEKVTETTTKNVLELFKIHI